jgi:hypothetical protein
VGIAADEGCSNLSGIFKWRLAFPIPSFFSGRLSKAVMELFNGLNGAIHWAAAGFLCYEGDYSGSKQVEVYCGGGKKSVRDYVPNMWEDGGCQTQQFHNE